MITTPFGRLHRRSVLIAFAAMLVSVGAFAVIGDIADAQGHVDHSDVDHHHGFTARGSETEWPPRPVGSSSMTATGVGEPSPEVAAQAGGVASQPGGEVDPDAETVVDELGRALGRSWVFISSEDSHTGKYDSTPAIDTYFSRTHNQTVLVELWPGGRRITTYPASEFQPVVGEAERLDSIEIGRNWLLENGYPAAGALEGYVIRALDDGAFYPQRMIYATYSTSFFDDPTHFVLIDMTNLTVIEGGLL